MAVKYETPKDIFNSLCHIPEARIDLGDGRILDIIEWRPEGKIYEVGVPVTIVGRIVEKEQTNGNS